MTAAGAGPDARHLSSTGMSTIPVRRALISVSDKTDLIPFARRLGAAGVEIVSSGGTASALEEAGIPVSRVAVVTGFPEILGGRVKTLHPAIHGGILADPSRDDHRDDLAGAGIAPFELVVVNLYPFEETVAAGGVAMAEAIEQIDIGGPAMIRAAAKNHAAVGVVVDRADYEEVAAAVESGGLGDDLRLDLARRAFFRTAAYDAAVVGYLEAGELPERMVLPLRRSVELRYGENPHQLAAAYAIEGGWWSSARQVQGKALSFNNLADTEAAWRLVHDLGTPAAAVVKHTNACGAAEADTVAGAFAAAWEGDPQAGFGGVVALNAPLDRETAEMIAEHFVEVVIAPDVSPEAAEVLSRKASLRVLAAAAPAGGDLDLRRVEGGFLVQRRDDVAAEPGAWDHKAGPVLADGAADDLRIAWILAAHTKSNAIVVVRDRAAVGVGAGDQSRVGAALRAVAKAAGRAAGAVAASDAFFPFRDGLDVLADAGVVAVAEPGGSRRDDEVIDAAAERGVSLWFTGRRHFRH